MLVTAGSRENDTVPGCAEDALNVEVPIFSQSAPGKRVAVKFTAVALLTPTRKDPEGLPGAPPWGALNCEPEGASVMVALAAMKRVTGTESLPPEVAMSTVVR